MPGRDSEVTVKEVWSPKNDARMTAAEPLIEAWAEGYSGKAGVPGLKKSSQGSHLGSASAGVSPSRIAVIGRQKPWRYLESQQAMTASAMVTLAGEKRAALRVIRELQVISGKRYVSPYGVAQIYATLNDKGQTYKWLEAAYRDGAVWMPYLAVDPVFDSIRSEERFRDLLRRVGLAQ